MDHSIPPPEAIPNDDQNLSKNWLKFKKQFMAYLKYIEQNTDTPLAIFLNTIGEYGIKIFNQLALNESQLNDIDMVLIAFDKHCLCDIDYERLMFYKRVQRQDENFDSFLVDIKKLAELCNFGEQKEEMLVKRLIFGLYDPETRGKLERLQNLSFANVCHFCRTSEMLTQQNKSVAVIGQTMAHDQSDFKYNQSTECVLQGNVSDKQQVSLNYYKFFFYLLILKFRLGLCNLYNRI